MTKNKDLKERIRARMAKTGESYAVARRQLLTKAGRTCPACKADLKTQTVVQMAEVDDLDDLSEGQAADYMAAQESGDTSEWGEEVEERYCPRCEPPRRPGLFTNLFGGGPSHDDD